MKAICEWMYWQVIWFYSLQSYDSKIIGRIKEIIFLETEHLLGGNRKWMSVNKFTNRLPLGLIQIWFVFKSMILCLSVFKKA